MYRRRVSAKKSEVSIVAVQESLLTVFSLDGGDAHRRTETRKQ